MIRALSFIIASFFVAPVYASFPDVPADSHENATAVEYVEMKDIVSGYPDGTFRPDIVINRAEFTKIIVRSVFTDDVIDGCMRGGASVFPDVPADSWYAKYVCTAKVYGLVQGYPDGTFRPSKEISFVEAAKIITVGLRLGASSSPGSVWYEHYVRTLAGKKAVPLSVQRFDKPLSRGEVAEIIWRVSVPTHGKPGFSYEDLNTLSADPVAFYVSKLGDKTMVMRYGHGYIWYVAPEELGQIGKPALPALLRALESSDPYVRTQAFYALKLAAQHPSVVSLTGGEYPQGNGEAFPPVSEHASLKAAWDAWYDKYAAILSDSEVMVQIFLVATPEDGEPVGGIGCGDRLVPVTRTLPRTESVVSSAVHQLVTLKEQRINGLYNVFYQSDLALESAQVAGGKATIRLIGELRLGGVCDEPRVAAQIEATVRQFTAIQSVEIFLNGEPLQFSSGG